MDRCGVVNVQWPLFPDAGDGFWIWVGQCHLPAEHAESHDLIEVTDSKTKAQAMIQAIRGNTFAEELTTRRHEADAT